MNSKDHYQERQAALTENEAFRILGLPANADAEQVRKQKENARIESIYNQAKNILSAACTLMMLFPPAIVRMRMEPIPGRSSAYGFITALQRKSPWSANARSEAKPIKLLAR